MAIIQEFLQDPVFVEKVPYTVQSYKALDEIVKESEEDRDVFLIMSGKVQVCTELTDNEQKLSPGLARLKEGDMFGELSLFDGEPRSAQVVALSDCEVARLNGEALLQFMDEHPDKGYVILREIFEHLVAHMRQNNIRSKTVLQLYLMENA